MGHAQHALCDAAQHQFFQPAATVRSHHDEVSARALDGALDAVVDRMPLAYHGVDAGDPCLGDSGLGGVQGRVRLGRRGTEVLRLAVGEIRAHPREGIRVDHVQRRHGAAEGLGQRCRLGHGLHGRLRAIDGNQNVLEHGTSFWLGWQAWKARNNNECDAYAASKA